MNGTVVNINQRRNSRLEVHHNIYRFSPVERQLLDALGGVPWASSEGTLEVVEAAEAMWAELSSAAGYAKPSRWFTDHTTNPKLGKAGLRTVGVTLHAARSAASAWREADDVFKNRVAAVLGCSANDVDSYLGTSFCPKASPQCIRACVTNFSYHSSGQKVQRTRILRDVFTIVRPKLALALTADQLARTVRVAGGKENSRRRVNISDDIRWEVMAPGLLEVAPKAYTYTKWLPEERPAVPGLSIVYSANERWSDADIVDKCEAGHRVAVVFNVAKGKLPTVWNGIAVVDGDSTDDLYEHPAGVIVGLAAKSPKNEVRRAMAASGFARAA